VVEALGHGERLLNTRKKKKAKEKVAGATAAGGHLVHTPRAKMKTESGYYGFRPSTSL
jgi:hypothetical protein